MKGTDIKMNPGFVLVKMDKVKEMIDESFIPDRQPEDVDEEVEVQKYVNKVPYPIQKGRVLSVGNRIHQDFEISENDVVFVKYRTGIDFNWIKGAVILSEREIVAKAI